MNLFTDIEGYIYFNEIFYALLKRAYSIEIFNDITPEGLNILREEENKVMKRIRLLKNKVKYYYFLKFFNFLMKFRQCKAKLERKLRN